VCLRIIECYATGIQSLAETVDVLGLLPGRHHLAHAWRSLFFAIVATGAWLISRRPRSDEQSSIHTLASIMQIMTLFVIGWSPT
jgi:hypothetical protein